MRGIGVVLREVKGGTARLSATAGGNGRVDAAVLRAEIEAMIVEAAPDLDGIVIEGLGEPQFSAALRPRGELSSLPGSTVSGNWVSQLRHFVSPPWAIEHCQFCQAPIAAEHPHLIELPSRGVAAPAQIHRHPDHPPRLALSPDPGRVPLLRGFAITDAQWASFRSRSTWCSCFSTARRGGRWHSTPARPARSNPRSASKPGRNWAAGNPVLNQLAPDVEALLVNPPRRNLANITGRRSTAALRWPG